MRTTLLHIRPLKHTRASEEVSPFHTACPLEGLPVAGLMEERYAGLVSVAEELAGWSGGLAAYPHLSHTHTWVEALSSYIAG